MRFVCCWEGSVLHRNETLALVYELPSLKMIVLHLTSRKAQTHYLSTVYPGAILSINNSNSSLAWMVECMDGQRIALDKDLKKSSARCRTYDPLTWRILKQLIYKKGSIQSHTSDQLVMKMFLCAGDVLGFPDAVRKFGIGVEVLTIGWDSDDLNFLGSSKRALGQYLGMDQLFIDHLIQAKQQLLKRIIFTRFDICTK